MRVKEGGNIVVVSGEKDQVTKSKKAVEDFKQNPQVDVISLSNGIHNTPITEADTLVSEIFEKQRISAVRHDIKEVS